jgi:hypothetical protein
MTESELLALEFERSRARALLMVLDALAPPERLAFVLDESDARSIASEPLHVRGF